MSHTEGRWGGCQAKKQAYSEEFMQQCGKNAILAVQKQKPEPSVLPYADG